MIRKECGSINVMDGLILISAHNIIEGLSKLGHTSEQSACDELAMSYDLQACDEATFHMNGRILGMENL
jgi:hypothetical protein